MASRPFRSDTPTVGPPPGPVDVEVVPAGRRSGVLATLASQWGRYVLQLLSLLVLARLLSPSDYGIVASVTAITGIAMVLGDFGLSLAAIQAPVLTQQQKSNLWWANVTIGLVTGILVAALGQPISLFYGRPELVAVCFGLAVVFPLSGATVQFSVELVRSGRFVLLGVLELAAAAAGLVTAVVAGAARAGYWALVLQQTSTALVLLVLFVVAVRWRPSRPRRFAGTRRFLTFGRDTAGLQVVNYLTSNLDSVLIGRIFGAVPLGLYNRAFQVVGVPVQQIAGPLTRVVLPALSARTDPDDFNASLVGLQRAIVLVLLAPLSLCAALAHPLLSLALGPEWGAAAPLLQVLAVGAAFQAIGFIYYWAFLARAATRTLFLSEVWGRGLSVVAMCALAPLGPIFIALGAALGQVAIWVCSAFIYSRRIDVPAMPLVRAAVPLLIATACSATCAAVASSSATSVPAEALVALVAWVLGLAVSLCFPPVRRSIHAGIDGIRALLQARH